MADVQHLSAMDSAFLHVEGARMPMHVASLHRYRLPEGYQGHWVDDVRAHLATRLHLAPVFTRKLAPMPLDLANPVWIEDDAIDLHYHVRHAVLPKPGTQQQLEALAARLHSRLLDRSRPLWQFHVIDGLADGTIGFYAKVHHAAVDGQAGIVLNQAMLDLGPEPRRVEPPQRRRGAHPPLGVAGMLGATASHTLRQAGTLARSLLPIGKALLHGARNSIAARGVDLGGLRQRLTLPPATPFNVPITPQRAFAALTLPLDEAKRLGKVHGASINDVVLWLCSSALREYLKERGALPAASLVAGVPVSLRAAGDTRMNNQVTMSLIELATQHDDPQQRLQCIQQATASMKDTMGAFGKLMPTDLPSLGAPWLLGAAAALLGRAGLAGRLRLANVTISNVPGSPAPLYLAGAKMLDYVPLSIPVHGVALNITVLSYLGQLGFGLIACRSAVPDLRDLARHIQRAFDTLAALPLPDAAAGPAPARAGAASHKTRARVVASKAARRRTSSSNQETP